MSSLVWRLRMFARRAIPHTPAKRLAYGLAVAIAVAAFAFRHPGWGLGTLGLAIFIRAVDLRLSGIRRGRVPTARAYFFEGDDKTPPTAWRR